MNLRKLTIVLIILPVLCQAQAPVEKEIHNREQLWVGYFNQTRLSKRWGFWLDVHY